MKTLPAPISPESDFQEVPAQGQPSKPSCFDMKVLRAGAEQVLEFSLHESDYFRLNYESDGCS
jgi:hypothetical protein